MRREGVCLLNIDKTDALFILKESALSRYAEEKHSLRCIEKVPASSRSRRDTTSPLPLVKKFIHPYIQRRDTLSSISRRGLPPRSRGDILSARDTEGSCLLSIEKIHPPPFTEKGHVPSLHRRGTLFPLQRSAMPRPHRGEARAPLYIEKGLAHLLLAPGSLAPA